MCKKVFFSSALSHTDYNVPSEYLIHPYIRDKVNDDDVIITSP